MTTISHEFDHAVLNLILQAKGPLGIIEICNTLAPEGREPFEKTIAAALNLEEAGLVIYEEIEVNGRRQPAYSIHPQRQAMAPEALIALLG